MFRAPRPALVSLYVSRSSAPGGSPAGAWRLGAVAVVLAGLTLAGGCKKTAAPAAARATPPVPVQIAVAEQVTLPITQSAIGTVQALRTVAVKSQVDGRLAKVHFNEGDDVKAGDLLVTLDRAPLENSLRIVKADLVNARAEALKAANDLERYRQLDQQAVVSKEQFGLLTTKAETTKALVQAKEAAVANAELLLSYTEIRAPISGRTGQLNVHEGALVRANDNVNSIVVINQLEPVATAYSVPESTLPALKAAMRTGDVKVVARNRTGGGPIIEGKLDFIDNAVDPTTGMILLKAVFENTDRTLWPGQFVDLTTHVGAEKDVILVPTPAVMIGQEGAQIFVVKDDKGVDLRQVKVGRAAQGRTVILTGVKKGETVVTDGQLRLLPNSKVEPKVLSEVAAAAGKPRGKKDGAAQGEGKAAPAATGEKPTSSAAPAAAGAGATGATTAAAP